MASKSIVGIDIGAHCVKAVRVENKGGYAVLGLGEEQMPNRPTEEQRRQALQSAVSKAGGRRGKCVIGVPRDQVVLRRIAQLPKGLDEESLQEVIRLQADSELPFDQGDAVYDYVNLREEEDSASVEIVAARLSDVERLVESARSAGARPVALCPSVFAIPLLARLDPSNGADQHLLIVDVGHAATEVGIMCHGAVETTRSFPIGSDHLRSGDARAPSLFIGELTRTVQAHWRDSEEQQQPFDAVWLWGGGAKTSFENLTEEGGSVSLAQLIEAQFQTKVVSDPQIRGFKDASKVDETPAGWHRFGVALGLAVGGLDDSLEANLIPKLEKDKHEQADRNRQAAVYALAAAAVIAATALLSSQIKRSQTAKLRDLNNEIAQYRAGKASAALQVADMRLMNGFLEPNYSPLDILRELTALLPDRPSIAATSFAFEDSGKVTIALEARSHDVVSETVRKIEASPWFENTRPSQITSAEKDRRQIQLFTLTTEVSGNAAVLAALQIGTGNEPQNGREEQAQNNRNENPRQSQAANRRTGGQQQGERSAANTRGGGNAPSPQTQSEVRPPAAVRVGAARAATGGGSGNLNLEDIVDEDTLKKIQQGRATVITTTTQAIQGGAAAQSGTITIQIDTETEED